MFLFSLPTGSFNLSGKICSPPQVIYNSVLELTSAPTVMKGERRFLWPRGEKGKKTRLDFARRRERQKRLLVVIGKLGKLSSQRDA